MSATVAQITVLFVEDTTHWRMLAEHDAMKQFPEVVVYDEDTPYVGAGRTLIDNLAALDARGAPLPDVLLVDDWLPWERGHEPRQNAARVAGEVTRLLGERRPKMVLWTGKQREPWLERYAFLSYGGHHVSHKNEPPDPDEAALEVIRKTMDGARAPAVRLIPVDGSGWAMTPADRTTVANNLDVLAWTYAGAEDDEIADRLGYTEGAVEKSRKRVGSALGRPDGERWSRMEVCEHALDAGWRWVPPSLWEHCPWEPHRRAGEMRRKRQRE